MHVVHLIRDLDSVSGGPSRSVPALARSLAAAQPGLRVTVIFQDRGNEITVNLGGEARQVIYNAIPAAMRLSLVGTALARTHADHPVSIVHLHGLWSPTLHGGLRAAKELQIPVVISPRGMLSEACLRVKSWRKSIAWNLYQRRDLNSAAMLHATSDAEHADCRRRGVAVPIHVIPNGCDPPVESDVAECITLPAGCTRPFAVALGRVDPVKGLDVLVDAWQQAAPSSWQLIIAGPGERGQTEALCRRIEGAGLVGRVHWIGALDDKQKWSVLAAASFLINASRSENFGIAIAEALSAGNPVIATRGTPWEIIEQKQCGWWVEGTVAGLAEAIRQATSKSGAQLNEMGQRGSQLIAEQFAWTNVAKKMLACYEQAMR